MKYRIRKKTSWNWASVKELVAAEQHNLFLENSYPDNAKCNEACCLCKKDKAADTFIPGGDLKAMVL